MRYIIGIDEVGRGPLAGPIVVAALAMPTDFKISKKGLKDSKKLSEIQREQWFRYVKQQKNIFYCVARVSPKVIDKINISAAANRAAYRAFNRLIGANSRLLGVNCLLDGGLFIKSKKYQKANHPYAKTVIKGDEKFDAVKLASIMAKVTRDRYMKRLHKKHPKYGFDIHKGYGTKSHYKAIKKYGVSDAHRLTFLKKYHNI